MSEAKSFHLTISSVGETQFDGKASSVTLPGAAGEMTILAHHEPLVTTLKKGTITVRDGSNAEKKLSCEGGLMECSNNRVVVLL